MIFAFPKFSVQSRSSGKQSKNTINGITRTKGTCVRVCLYVCNQHHRRRLDIVSDSLKTEVFSSCPAVTCGIANPTSSLVAAWESSAASRMNAHLDIPFLGFCLLWFSLMTSLPLHIQTHLPPPWRQTQPIRQGPTPGSFPWPNPPHCCVLLFTPSHWDVVPQR